MLYPYWISLMYPSWVTREPCAQVVSPFPRAGRRRLPGTRRDVRYLVRSRVGWALVQIGLRLVVRPAEAHPGTPAVLREQHTEDDDR